MLAIARVKCDASHTKRRAWTLQAGYTNVVHLKGGISTWRFTKNPTEKS